MSPTLVADLFGAPTENPAEVVGSTGSTPRGVTGDGPVSATYATHTAAGSGAARAAQCRAVTYVALDSGQIIRQLLAHGTPAPREYPRTAPTDERPPRVLVHDEDAPAAENLQLAEMALELLVTWGRASFVPMIVARPLAAALIERRITARLQSAG